MSIFNKLAGLFVEYEDEEDDDEEEQVEETKEETSEEPKEEKLARKVELPKSIFKAYHEKKEKEEQEQEEVVEPNILDSKNESYFEVEKEEKDEEDNEVVPPKEEVKEEPEVKEEVEEKEDKDSFSRVHMFDDRDFYNDEHAFHEDKIKVSHEKELYPEKPSIMDKYNGDYTKPSYDRKNNSRFKPSPIISPVYGILDKNYKKEEIITKKDNRTSSSYEKADLDAARSKILGGNRKEEKEEKKKNDHKEKKIVDTNKDKPSVNHITLGDADDYYKDLGLEYNVDYQDNSKNVESRVQRHEGSDDKKDDNLFDLIDSMYKKED